MNKVKVRYEIHYYFHNRQNPNNVLGIYPLVDFSTFEYYKQLVLTKTPFSTEGVFDFVGSPGFYCFAEYDNTAESSIEENIINIIIKNREKFHIIPRSSIMNPRKTDIFLKSLGLDIDTKRYDDLRLQILEVLGKNKLLVSDIAKKLEDYLKLNHLSGYSFFDELTVMLEEGLIESNHDNIYLNSILNLK